jgi:hypothetical protein
MVNAVYRKGASVSIAVPSSYIFYRRKRSIKLRLVLARAKGVGIVTISSTGHHYQTHANNDDSKVMLSATDFAVVSVRVNFWYRLEHADKL